MKLISIDLFDTDSIQQAIREVDEYQKSLDGKTKTFQKRVASRIAELAQSGFNGSISAYEMSGPVPANVSVSTNEDGSLVIASGEDAIWVEFGAGVMFNGSVGSRPHPVGDDEDPGIVAIGTYGKGDGAKNTWVWVDPATNQKHFAHGTPMQAPLYQAMTLVANEIQDIAKEVYADD